MSAPILSRKEQKKSLSGIKNRKKGQKNILAAPGIVEISKPVVDSTQIINIYRQLSPLLTKFSSLRKDKKLGNKDKVHPVEDGLEIGQLLFGINSVSRGINNGSVHSMILADDIKPKLLIHHLIELCTLKNIPFIYMANIRQLTKMTLGFTCIALGFKKDSAFFSPVTSLIAASMQNQNKSVAKTPIEITEEKKKVYEELPKAFTYLFRDSMKKRTFVPEVDTQMQEQDNSFISLSTEDVIKKCVPVQFEKEVKSFRVKKNVIIEKKTKSDITNEDHDFPVEYAETNIIKMGGNPNRDKKKYKKLKKGKKL